LTPSLRRSNPLRPPSSLSKPEAELFDQIVGNCSQDHFKKSDLPLLARYCEASILAERAAAELRSSPIIGGKVSPWLLVQEKSVRTLTALSMRLRLSPQARKGHNPLSPPRPLTYSDTVRLRNGGCYDDDGAEPD
jgi:phage terminase small subunit